ncbi:uncharacterized protein BKA55DRAFT_595649 [Fusarium redolens]|uniref:Uncharacterized protein n=1 Tax=Fusarium redolens TaxID=48865 RepID=A0A9P9GTS0_FUSRE|nr:uncharacterized protein BKA55DRAFT_595649 [Fusarium redolens]KAH7244538.1 hypothetical protein BKA55DRAFT_595649 [Fusarium redolens]
MAAKCVIPLLLSLLRREVLADRPPNQSVCDYYAAQRYGKSNSTTQLLLMQSIVAYAYAGGSSLPHAESNSTGIFNHGQFEGQDVYLRPWFDGSNATTNLNEQAVVVDWLDGGGTAPLIAFLNGSTATAEIKNGTNQYHVKEFLETSFTPLTPAYVHKFMNLNQTHIGYFIDQFITASKYYGFSDTDAATLSTFMNARYNIRCSPPVDGQLYAICLAKDCPLAAPDAECDMYSSIPPYGVNNTAVPSGTGTMVLPTTLGSSASSSSSLAGTSGATSTAAASGSSSSLSGGAIAGIAIGAAAVSLLAVGVWLFFRRQQQAQAMSYEPGGHCFL